MITIILVDMWKRKGKKRTHKILSNKPRFLSLYPRIIHF